MVCDIELHHLHGLLLGFQPWLVSDSGDHMKRWNSAKKAYGENHKVDAFLEEIWAVCEKHQLCLGHEDRHGAFLVQPIVAENRRWLFDAHDDTDPTMGRR